MCMNTNVISVNFDVFDGLDELQKDDMQLAQEALDAVPTAYAPYSGFLVGAAVRLDDGTVVRGSNQENAAYPSGLCAERTALFAAGAGFPGRRVVSMAIAGGPGGRITDLPVTPCGACRQVMAETTTRGGKFSLILVGGKKIYRFEDASSLLPLGFTSEIL